MVARSSLKHSILPMPEFPSGISEGCMHSHAAVCGCWYIACDYWGLGNQTWFGGFLCV